MNRRLSTFLFVALLSPLCRPAVVPTIQISPVTADLRPGQTKVFGVSASGGAQTQNLTWKLLSAAASYTGALGTFDAASRTYTAPPVPPVPNTVVLQAQDPANAAIMAKATITLQNPIPAITGLEPSAINAKLPYAIVIKGTGFLPASQVQWDGKAVASTFDSAAGALKLAGSAAPAAGTAKLAVVNPNPGGSTSNSRTLTITQVSVQVSPDGRTVRTGGTLSLTSKVLNNSNQAVSWSVQGGSSFGTVDSGAIYHAPSVLPNPPAAVVTAKSTADPSASASLTIQLQNVVPAISALEPSAINTALPYTVTIKGTGIVAGAQVMLGNAAAPSTFDAKTGFLTISGTGPAVGAIPVTVINPQSGGTASNAKTLNVLPAVSVQLSPDGRTVRCGTTLSLSVKVVNNTDQTVSWVVNGGGSVDSTGVYKAPAILPTPADVTVTATAKADPKAAASITLHLTNPAPVITSVSPSPLIAGSTAFTINGSGFAKTASIYFAGAKVNTAWVSDMKLTASGDFGAAPGGMAAVKVLNPDPGGLVSAPVFVPVSLPGKMMSYADAVRFLELASWGPSPGEVARLMSIGRDVWLEEQSDAAKTPPTPFPPPNDTGEGVSRLQDAFFTRALTGHDQLRQRVAFALSEIFVVSAVKDTRFAQMAPYMTLLSNNAFGNFRALLEHVTKNPAMGYFLDMVNNDKANPVRNTVANENYARELMQLFTLGLVALNQDGTSQSPAASVYDETTVKEMAKVMTGWTYAPQPNFASHWTNPAWYFDPMIPFQEHHDTTAKSLQFNGGYACSLPAGGTAQGDLTLALDCLFNHKNLAPFISYRLIQRLVTSSPTPAYVEKVAGVFKRTNGDLKAVVKAILTDEEALRPLKLNEPVLYITRLLRSLNATVTPEATGLRSQTSAMGQDVLAAPSVFNYFSPFFRVQGTVAPEFQILNAATALGRLNFVNRVVNNQISGNVRVDFTNWDDLSTDPAKLIEAVNQALYRGQMTADEKSAVSTALAGAKTARTMVRNALYVAAAAPQYQVEQ